MARVSRDLVIAVVLFVLGLWQNLSFVESTIFHRDEARWIHRSQFVAQLVHPLSAYWEDSEVMRGQPPLGSYLMGIGLLAQGRGPATNDLWSFYFGTDWNRRHGAMPSPEDHLAARQTDAVVGALIVVAVYFIGRALVNRVAGVAGALLLIPHPLAIYLWSLADSDALLALCVALAALAAIALARRPTWPRAIVLGALLGLGGATKLSPLLIPVPLAALGLLLLVLARRRTDPDAARVAALGWRLLPLPVVAFATFILVYPYLWPDPIGRTLILFEFRADEMNSQGEIWDELDVPGPTAVLGRIGYWLGDVDSTTGRIAAAVAARFGSDRLPGGIDLLLALIGVEVFVVLVVRHGLGSPHALAGAVLGAQLAAIVLGMRADFERYLMPVLVVVAVCAGLFAGQVWEAGRSLVAEWRVRRAERVVAVSPELPPRPAQA